MMKVTKLDYLIELTYDKSYHGFVADVVNLFGCMSQGKTREEALKNTDKAIKAYMQALVKRTKGLNFVQRSIDSPIPAAYA